MERPQFANENIYHIYNRGVEKRKVFLNEKDYLRFILCLYEFNDSAPAFNFSRTLNRHLIEVRLQSPLQSPRKRTFVEILAFCLMPNHYHLLLKQKVENGVTEFMRKLGTGYTNYFNIKYQRVGPLFQGKFKAVLLNKEGHFAYLPHYIHLNPLDLISSTWREQKPSPPKAALNFLKNYRWSSLPDYLGKKNFPTVTERFFLTECIGGPKEFSKHMQEWLRVPDFEFIQNVTIEPLN